MTLIIGVRCENAVVVAADSAATLGALGSRTVWQPTSNKVQVIDDKGLIAVSGPVGLAQRFQGELGQLMSKPKFLKHTSTHIMTEISAAFRKHISVEFAAAQSAAGLLGNGIAGQDALSSSLVSVAGPDGPTLFEFTAQGAPEEMTEGIPFSIGIGKSLADPYMALFRQLFWPKMGFPTRAVAEFAMIWAMRQSIAVAPGGIAEPIQLYRLEGNGTKYVAYGVDETDITEHFDLIKDAGDSLRKWYQFDAKSATDTGAVEEPPK